MLTSVRSQAEEIALSPALGLGLELCICQVSSKLV